MLRSLPHGQVAAVFGTARKVGLDRRLVAGRAPARLVALVLAMVVAQVIDTASKLATARQLDAVTATASLGPLLGLGVGRFDSTGVGPCGWTSRRRWIDRGAGLSEDESHAQLPQCVKK